MLTALLKLWRDDSGATTVDYAILIAVVALGGALAWEKLGSAITGQLSEVTDELAGRSEGDGVWRQAASAAQLP
ncbi:MAG: Flp family type IVb pilin [Armatimonadetes bacterium]|nr:Flp family type IVb pilin [Armatimonadota bacterium]